MIQNAKYVTNYLHCHAEKIPSHVQNSKNQVGTGRTTLWLKVRATQLVITENRHGIIHTW